MLRDSLALLARLMREPHAPYPVHDGTRETLAEHGVAYYLEPRRRRREEAPWFGSTRWAELKTSWAQRQGVASPRWDDHDVLFLVHWPMLLRTASPLWAPSPMRAVAHRLLRDLVPLISHYDAALALMIQRFETAWAHRLPEALDMPLFFGQESVLDESLFHAHLMHLVGNKDFRRRLEETMRGSLRVVSARRSQERLGLCAARHRKGLRCEACEDGRWVRRYTSLLWPGRLASVMISTLGAPQFSFPELWAGGINDPWLSEARHWLSLLEPDEGVIRLRTPGYGESLLVDFGRVLARRRIEGRESPLARIDDTGSHDWWFLGARARRLFDEATSQRYLARRPAPLKDLVEAQGWEWRETLDVPYELLSLHALSQRLHRAKGRRLAVRNPVTRRPSKRTTKAVTLSYDGRAVTVIRRKKIYRLRDDPADIAPRNYYSLPFDVSGAVTGRQGRRGLAVRVSGELFWNLQGVNHLVNLERWPEALPFRDWILEQDEGLTSKRFTQLCYEAHYGARVAKKQAGELAHLGSFTGHEDTTVRAFLEARPPGSHRMSRAEWGTLLERLPGRNVNGVLRRLEELGKEYAREQGYQAYLNSPLCLRRSAARGKRWRREGIR